MLNQSEECIASTVATLDGHECDDTLDDWVHKQTLFLLEERENVVCTAVSLS